MRLFKRKRHDEALRCTGCGELAPAGARECSMCGGELDPERNVALQVPAGEAREVGRHWG
jgi:rRNA maturation endonuclease Nob1